MRVDWCTTKGTSTETVRRLLGCWLEENVLGRLATPHLLWRVIIQVTPVPPLALLKNRDHITEPQGQSVGAITLVLADSCRKWEQSHKWLSICTHGASHGGRWTDCKVAVLPFLAATQAHAQHTKATMLSTYVCLPYDLQPSQGGKQYLATQDSS